MTELQKKKNWIKADILALNSILAFNSKKQDAAGKTWKFAKSQ